MKIKEIPAKPKEKQRLRVAAYARVSAEKDATFHSLEAQTEYYEAYIAAHEDWELVGIYSDNGISGTIINRPEFQRLLEDCRQGKIDLVITKSITRFARNTVILLETIRELKNLGIDCYFEKENMHSISPDGELMLTLLAMYAEEEARSVSENMNWRVKKRFEQGEPWTFHIYGYEMVDGEIQIVPEKAAIVQRIYQEYLDGSGPTIIAKRLNLEGITSPKGGVWATSSIDWILHCQDYTGTLTLQKTYRKNFRTKKSIPNHGERRKYVVDGLYAPIISEETFLAVQKERERRSVKQQPSSGPYLFTGLIICGECGHRYVRKVSKREGIVSWICPLHRDMGKEVCPGSGRIREESLVNAAKEALETEEITRALLLEKVESIVVYNDKTIVFSLKTGETRETKLKKIPKFWSEESRREASERGKINRRKQLEKKRLLEKEKKGENQDGKTSSDH